MYMQALGSRQEVGEGGVLVLALVLTKGMAAPQMRCEQVSKKDKKRKNKAVGRCCSSYGHCSSHGHRASPSGLTPCTMAQRDAHQQLAASYQPSRNPCNSLHCALSIADLWSARCCSLTSQSRRLRRNLWLQPMAML